MQFAGNNYVYISQKKKAKVKELMNSNKDAPPKVEMQVEEDKKEEKIAQANQINALEKIKEKNPKKENLSDSSSASNERLSVDLEELNDDIEIEEGESDPPFYQDKRIRKGDIRSEIDTNVLALQLGTLEETLPPVEGKIIKCQNCGCFLNMYSSIQAQNNGFEWKCEFCTKINTVTMDKDSIPISASFDSYINKKVITSTKDLDNETSLVFCFDVSGSMSQSYQVNSELLHKFRSIQKRSKENNLYCDSIGYSHDSGYISRLECLQIAIENNIKQLIKESPKVKVGLVTFGSDVEVLGDCLSNRIVLKQKDSNNEKKIISLGLENQNLFQHSVSESHSKVIDSLYNCEENGQTALGPAVLLSLSMLDKAPIGSRIFLCTDGCSNLGVGTITTDIEDSKQFYIQMGEKAKEKGIAISLITFQDSESEIVILQEMVKRSGGEIIRVKPQEILDDFNDLLSNRIVASNVSFTINLNRYLTFRNEEKSTFTNNGSSLSKEVGNASKETELYYEFKFKKAFKLADMENVNLESGTLPFQVVIKYVNKQGNTMQRVITRVLKISDNKSEIEKQAIFDIISANAMQKAANFAAKGDYTQAQGNAFLWRRYMNNNSMSNNNARSNFILFNNNFSAFNRNLYNARVQSNLNNQFDRQPDNLNSNFLNYQNRDCNIINNKLYSNILEDKYSNIPLELEMHQPQQYQMPQENLNNDEFLQQIHTFQNVSQKRQQNYLKRRKK